MLEEYLKLVKPSDKENVQKAKIRWSKLAKPLNGMGVFEDYISKIAGISYPVDISKKCVAVMCSDNGVVCEKVTQTDSSVTAVVAKNITEGKATVANMALVCGADVYVYDVGICTQTQAPIIDRKQALGTDNITKGPAMSYEAAEKTIIAGIEAVRDLKAKGYNLIAGGEMGIGNTTTSSAIAAVLLDESVENVTGRGAGLSSEGLERKINAIKKALQVNNINKDDPVDILAKVGGFDICGMCGLFIGGAIYGVPIIIDGLISSVAALLAYRIAPDTIDYMIPSHMSAEPAAKMLMEKLGLKPCIYGSMALGEGTGAVAVMPLLDMAYNVFSLSLIHI